MPNMFSLKREKFESSSSVGKNNGKQRTFIADSALTGCDTKFCCKCKGENSSNESNNESYSPPPGTGSTFAACHLP